MTAINVPPSITVENCHIGKQVGSSLPVFQNYMLQKLLQYNPWWLKETPAWCKDIHLSNEAMAGKANNWCSDLVWDRYLEELQQFDGIACPMEISIDEVFGRHLTATRDILPGEMLLIEPPLVLGLRPKSPAYCSTCFKRAEDFVCPACGFFFCGPECLTEAHKDECLILQRLGFVESAREKQEEEKLVWDRLATMTIEQQEQAQAFLQRAQASSALQRRFEVMQHYVIVPVVRTLVTMNQSDLLRDVTLTLQGIVNENSQRYRVNQKNIVDVIVNKLKVCVEPSFLHQICSIWDTNSFEVPLVWGTRVHGIYPFAALLTHDCRANTQQWFTNSGNLVLRAVDHIPRGKIITTCYTDPQWPTMLRQDHLKISKQFTCTCRRCTDQTECGTFLGSPLCSNCKGLLISSAPLDPTAQWICNKGCSHTATATEVASVGASIGSELRGIDPTNIQGINNVADQLQKKLHPSHHIMLQLHVSNLRNLATRDLSEMTDEELINMSSMATLVMDVVRRLEAPLTRLTVRMAREDLRLRLESLKRHKERNHQIRDQLQVLSQHVRDCELALGWDARMPDFTPVLKEYKNLMNSFS